VKKKAAKSNGAAKAAAKPSIQHKYEVVPIGLLKPHPRNYRDHPEDQVAHLIESLSQFGVYRNVVVARDNTILAGHGVAKAAKAAGFTEIPVVRMDIDPTDPDALKILVGDNEVEHLAEQDDRLLSELLKEVSDKHPSGLLGTGFDKKMLAAFIMVTRTTDEIKDFDAAAEWVGMPDFVGTKGGSYVWVHFETMEARAKFCKLLGLTIRDDQRTTYYPPKEARNDQASVKFTVGAAKR
jgi:hypothetical protein